MTVFNPITNLVSEDKVDVEAECRNAVDDVNGATDEVKDIWTGNEADEEFEGKPGVAYALDIEEGIVRICSLLVQCPGGAVRRGPERILFGCRLTSTGLYRRSSSKLFRSF